GTVARMLRRGQRFRTARAVDEPEIAFVDGDRLRQQDLAVVRGPVGGLIAAALQLEHHAVARRLGRVHHPKVQIASVAPRGHVGVTVALVRPGAADVPRLAVGQHGDITGRDIVAVLLEELRTADVLREHDVATVGRLVRGAGDGVGEERQLCSRPARKRDAVQLGRVAEPGGDDHLASRRVPVPEVGGSKLPVAARHVGDARRDRRHPVHHEILGPRRGGASLGERATGDERGEGCWLYDEQGKDYLDAVGGAYVANLGHSNPDVADALARQAREFGYLSATAFTHGPVEELARELAASLPGDLDKLYFLSSGSEAVEAALKLARQYWVEAGKPGKHRIIALAPSYHGNTLLALSASAREQYKLP